jgi:hypothetical protein
VRVDTADNRIIRIAGNPYHPLATTHPAPMETPVREVYAMLGGDNGLEGRATSCARGSAMLEHQKHRTAFSSRSSAWAHAAPASGRASRSKSWFRKSAKAAISSAKAMWTACAPSATSTR